VKLVVCVCVCVCVCVWCVYGVCVCVWPLNCLLALSPSIRQTGMWKDRGILSLNHLHPLKSYFKKDDLHHGSCAPEPQRQTTNAPTQMLKLTRVTPEPGKHLSVSVMERHTNTFRFCAGEFWIFMFSFLFSISTNLHDLEEYLVGSPSSSDIRAYLAQIYPEQQEQNTHTHTRLHTLQKNPTKKKDVEWFSEEMRSTILSVAPRQMDQLIN